MEQAWQCHRRVGLSIPSFTSGHSEYFSFYRCNKYEEAKAKGESSTVLEKEEQKMQEARNALQKYMFYFTRFDNHQKSIQFARKTRQDAETRMQQLRDIQGTNYQDVQFVLNAVGGRFADP
ncbi:hypothetical protein BVRB_035510 [Beta vulgaris subsp. vulgaris]|uniref:Uncharacterized protein n=1 Tax=Beta vulgaris subsp. vulgaris TaxID=3555 RepID=A0A0J7YPF7_BETVV|nr:hypothetical protein BVRB_035510 [Beta vulgaris subsp. vulgaris]